MIEIKKIGYQYLGFQPYSESLRVQEQLRELLIEKKTGFDGFLLFLYHEPVITLGKYSDNKNLLVNREKLSQLGVGFCRSDRGGDITCHEPGQIVIYPIINLRKFNFKLREYVYLLEGVVIETLKQFQIQSERIEGKPGIWIGGSKIASLGIGVKRHCTKHGIALNVNNGLKNFECINPCGLRDTGVTSVKKLISREVDLGECADNILNIFSNTFNANMYEIDVNNLVFTRPDQIRLSV